MFAQSHLDPVRRPWSRSSLRSLAVIASSIVAATLAVALLEIVFGLPDASSVYLVAVVLAAMTAGTAAALATAVIGVLTYDLVFTAPAMTLQIADTGEWLSLLLLSFVGITVGQLVVVQRRRTDEALAREREAQALYAVSHALATRASTQDVLPSIARILAARATFDRVWIGFGENESRERVVADTGSGPLSASPSVASLRRTPDGQPGEWVIIHSAGRDRRPPSHRRPPSPGSLRYRVVIDAAGNIIGSLWGVRPRSASPVDPTATRLLAATADQIGQAAHQDRLATRAADAKVAQESDALKSALVELVSHDLRIPLASIRAAAGPLMGPSAEALPASVQEAAASIDREAARLDRLVANLLDLGRIQAGMLKTRCEAVELKEVVLRSLRRVAETTLVPADHPIEQRVEESWVDADPVLLQQAVRNVLENALRHTPPGTPVVISASRTEAGAWVRLSIEDGGRGVSAEALPRLFERFYRTPSSGTTQRPGSGIGLAVARGFVEAMGGRISARQSRLGGLAIDMDLPATLLPEHLKVGA